MGGKVQFSFYILLFFLWCGWGSCSIVGWKSRFIVSHQLNTKLCASKFYSIIRNCIDSEGAIVDLILSWLNCIIVNMGDMRFFQPSRPIKFSKIDICSCILHYYVNSKKNSPMWATLFENLCSFQLQAIIFNFQEIQNVFIDFLFRFHRPWHSFFLLKLVTSYISFIPPLFV